MKAALLLRSMTVSTGTVCITMNITGGEHE